MRVPGESAFPSGQKLSLENFSGAWGLSHPGVILQSNGKRKKMKLTL